MKILGIDINDRVVTLRFKEKYITDFGKVFKDKTYKSGIGSINLPIKDDIIDQNDIVISGVILEESIGKLRFTKDKENILEWSCEQIIKKNKYDSCLNDMLVGTLKIKICKKNLIIRYKILLDECYQSVVESSLITIPLTTEEYKKILENYELFK